jgi:hypothetical protein
MIQYIIMQCPNFDFENSSSGLDNVYIDSGPDSLFDTMNNSEVTEDARLRLMIASSYLSDMLRYRSEHPGEVGVGTVDFVMNALYSSRQYLMGQDDNLSHPELEVGDEHYYREFDSWSIAAFEHTDFSKLRAGIEKIVEKSSSENFHFLPMANGALPVTLLGWNLIADNLIKPIDLYPVLYSRTKAEHHLPKLSEDEDIYFQKCASDGDSFIIFEEDTETGETMRNMMHYLIRNIGVERSKIYGLTTRYSRNGEHRILRLGLEGLEAEVL